MTLFERSRTDDGFVASAIGAMIASGAMAKAPLLR